VNGIAMTLMDDLQQSFSRNGHDAIVTLSIGGAVYPDDANSREELLNFADKALYYAKAQGKNNVKLFSDLSETSL
jgi:diguanylate cyclase (GGDEF)-like protein